MQVLRKRPQGRRGRLNCDTLLAFDGVNQYADAGVNENVIGAVDFDKDWSISFVYEQPLNTVFTYIISLHNNDSQGYGLWVYQFGDEINVGFGYNNAERKTYSWKISPGSLHHVLVRWNSQLQDLTLDNNGYTKYPNKITDGVLTQTVYRKIPRLLLALADNVFGNTRYSPQLINHLSFFNRSLTHEEIQQIHRYGGYLPESTHQNCVAHYVADREGLRMWDVVGQYNYVKQSLGLPALTAHHADLINFTPQQVDTEAGTQNAYLDFYDKNILTPFLDSDSDGTPDQPLLEKSSLLPPLQNALKFTITQSGSAGIVGSIQGLRFAVKQTAIDQPLFSLDGTASTDIAIDGGVLSLGSNLLNATVCVDGNEHTLAEAGSILNDLKLHDVVLQFDSIAATDFQITGGEKHLAALAVVTGELSKKDAVRLANNTLLANPTVQQHGNLGALWNLNTIDDDGAGNYSLSDSTSANQPIILSGFTANNLDDQHADYALTPINDLR